MKCRFQFRIKCRQKLKKSLCTVLLITPPVFLISCLQDKGSAVQESISAAALPVKFVNFLNVDGTAGLMMQPDFNPKVFRQRVAATLALADLSTANSSQNGELALTDSKHTSSEAVPKDQSAVGQVSQEKPKEPEKTDEEKQLEELRTLKVDDHCGISTSSSSFSLSEGSSTVIPDGRLVFCEKGNKTQYVPESKIIPEFLLSLGISSQELRGIKTYYVRDNVPNAFGGKAALGQRVLVMSEALLKGSNDLNLKPADSDDEIAGILIHEMGHAKDIALNSFQNMGDAIRRADSACKRRTRDAKSTVEIDARAETCMIEMSHTTQLYEFRADQNVVDVYLRHKNDRRFNPFVFISWLEGVKSGDEKNSSHPPSKTRAFYLRRSLKDNNVAEAQGGVKNRKYLDRLLQE